MSGVFNNAVQGSGLGSGLRGGQSPFTVTNTAAPFPGMTDPNSFTNPYLNNPSAIGALPSNSTPGGYTVSNPTDGAPIDITPQQWQSGVYPGGPNEQAFDQIPQNQSIIQTNNQNVSNAAGSFWTDFARPALETVGPVVAGGLIAGVGAGAGAAAGDAATAGAGVAGASADPFAGAIPTDTLFSGGPGTAGVGAGADPFANIGVDQFGNPIAAGASGDPFANIGVDQFGNPIGGAGAGAAASGGSGLGSAGGLAGAGANLASRFLGGGGQPGAAGGGGNPFMNFLTGQGGGPSLPGLAPGLAALQYARQQTPIDTSQLQSVFNQAGANAPLFVQAAQDPLKQAQAGGYGDILNSQAQRGIRGSSFGDQSIANYMTDTNRGIADAGTNAAQAALGLQGGLAGQISNLNALSQQMKNNLYGRAFSSLGQGLNPTPGMGFGGGSAGGGGVPGKGLTPNGFLSNLNLGGAASSIGNAFGNVLGSAGSGLGSLFGSPGSTFWGNAPIQGMPTDYLGDMAGF